MRPMYSYVNNLNEFFLEWETFQTKVVGKITKHMLCSIIYLFPKIVSFIR
jgi:hypothetical protein